VLKENARSNKRDVAWRGLGHWCRRPAANRGVALSGHDCGRPNPAVHRNQFVQRRLSAERHPVRRAQCLFIPRRQDSHTGLKANPEHETLITPQARRPVHRFRPLADTPSTSATLPTNSCPGGPAKTVIPAQILHVRVANPRQPHAHPCPAGAAPSQQKRAFLYQLGMQAIATRPSESLL